MNKKKAIIIIIVTVFITMYLNNLWLSGVIIDNPYQGTTKGGIFASFGTAIIIIGVVIIGYVINLITKKVKNQNDVR